MAEKKGSWGSKGKKQKIIMVTSVLKFTLYQQNGQRTYGGPPPNWGNRPIPSRDCEVFIGRLPRICFEDELIPLFLGAGELYEFRLMLDFSGTNRGYGYAHYATPEGAKRAIETLNKFEIRPGHFIGVLKSKNNCRLLFGNIKLALHGRDFNEFIRNTTSEVLNVFMFKSFQELIQTDYQVSDEMEEAFLGRMPRNNGDNQFAIVEYENHKAAAVARRILIPKYGHVLAIDWAVPPHERIRFVSANKSQPAVERPLLGTQKDSNFLMLSKSNSKIRPVPMLVVQPPSPNSMEEVFKIFKTVVKFFKYQLSVCLYKSVDQLEIPLFICKEIEKKIVDRITNMENCSQAVQLIFNYLSWYNEKKRLIKNSEVHKMLLDVKFYADSFDFFFKRKQKHHHLKNPEEDKYYLNILPSQLSVLFRIILHSNPENRAKLSIGITKGLHWLLDVMQSGNRQSREFINQVINSVKNEDWVFLDKASTLAKTLFLNNVTSHQPQYFANNMLMDSSVQQNIPFKNERRLDMNVPSRINGNQVSSTAVAALQKVSSNLNSQHLMGNTGHFIPMPFSQMAMVREEPPVLDSTSAPSVPVLLVQPSIMNKVPFMPDIFEDVLVQFKFLIRISLNVLSSQLNIIPFKISKEIEKKIIDRISNMENCSKGIQLILNYLFLWLKKDFNNQRLRNLEALKLLEEIKVYADCFVNFVWNKTKSVCIPNETEEHYFCKILPLHLNILFHMMMIFNSENPNRYLIGITRGLNWLVELIRRKDPTANQFLDQLIKYILESDQTAYERAKFLGMVFCTELMNFNGQVTNLQVSSSFLTVGKIENKCPSNSSLTSEIPSCSSASIGDSASDFDS